MKYRLAIGRNYEPKPVCYIIKPAVTKNNFFNSEYSITEKPSRLANHQSMSFKMVDSLNVLWYIIEAEEEVY
jgi:hypothetical protein